MLKFARSSSGLYLPQGRQFSKWIDRRLIDDPRHSWQFRGPIAMAMAMQGFGGTVLIPTRPGSVSHVPSFTSSTINADGEGVGMVFYAPKTGTITGFGTLSGTLTTGDANTLFQLESCSAAITPAVPNGIIGAGRSATVNVAASNTWYDAVFGTSYSATQGELMAVTVTRQAGGSLDSGMSCTFTDEGTSGSTGVVFNNYSVVKTGASWTAGGGPVFAINYGGTYYQIDGAYPVASFTTNTFGTGSTPDVYGNVLIPRVKMRVVGLWAWMDLNAATQLNFYDTDGTTILAACSATANVSLTTNAGIFVIPFSDSFGPVNVTPTVGSTYRIGNEPTTASTIAQYEFAVNAAAIMSAFEFGADMYKTSAKNPAGTGDWTNVTTSRMFMGILVDQFDDGVSAGGGGLLTHPGMAGGMRG